MMADYSDEEHSIKNQTPTGHSSDDDVESLSTEEHAHTYSTSTNWCLRAITTMLYALWKYAYFSFSCVRNMGQHVLGKLTDSSDVTTPLLSCTNNRPANISLHEEDYARTFHLKIMCLESMHLPSLLIEQYGKVHDPNVLATIDRSVQQIHQHRQSANILKNVMESNPGHIMQSERLWRKKLEQHESIIELNVTQLVDILSKAKEDTLAEMVDTTAQSAAESQSRQALIDLNKSMLAASHAEPAVLCINGIQSVQKPSAWTPSLSQEDIDRHRQAIETKFCSKRNSSVLQLSNA